jgi:hypothetical protein
MSVPRSVPIALTLLLLPAGASAAAPCDDDGVHGAAVVAARDAVLAACPCAEVASRTAYSTCARAVTASRVASGELPRACQGRVRSFASRSTCGRPGFVACCVRSAASVWRPRLGKATRGCVAPRGGGACLASVPHLEQACDAENGCGSCGDGVVDPASEGCEPPGTATCDDECRRIPFCGNGAVEFYSGEECEPPGSATCDAACQFIHTCGNGVVELGEECDGQTGCSDDCRLARATCCEFAGPPGTETACMGNTAYDEFEVYFYTVKPCFQILSGQFAYGTCEGPPCPGAPPGFDCHLGACGDRAIDPLPLCCQEVAGGCRDAVVTTAAGVGGFGCGAFPPPEEGDVDRLMIGTCGGDGRCVPGG